MNEVCMVPWRLLDSRSEQLPRGASSRAGAFIWEIPVAARGGVEPGSCRRLPAELSCHGWMWNRTLCLPTLLVQRALQTGGRARPSSWEGNRDLPIVPDAWLLPLAAVERAGSSKITKTGNCWELGLMEPAARQVWKWHRVKGCSKQCRVTSGQRCVLWAALHPHRSLSPCQSDALEWCLAYLPLQSSLEVELKSQGMDMRWKQRSKVLWCPFCFQMSSKCLFLWYRRILTK